VANQNEKENMQNNFLKNFSFLVMSLSWKKILEKSPKTQQSNMSSSSF